MADLFTVIADPTRREILRVLLERRDDATSSPASAAGFAHGDAGAGEINVGDLVIELSLSQPTVSKHLRVLRDSGLVHVREKGQHRYYSLETGPLHDLEKWLHGFLAPVEALVAAEAVSDAATEVVPAASGGPLRPVPVPAPLRRAAENLPDAKDVGATLGRAVAQAQNRASSAVKKRLGRRD
ncbi:ArsR/SmtB family transcription factor [Frondihabitans cladoniiphilus]|uniref:HTH arsR-type domain-containing protein n=1 Tax=Frondihabitans cladoniiphilus TaxID=715785 RepID=A0ABP8W335_9MICO